MKRKIFFIFLIFTLIFEMFVFSAESRGITAVPKNTVQKTVDGAVPILSENQVSNIYSIAYSPNGKYIATAINPLKKDNPNAASHVSLWNMQTGELERNFESYKDVVWSVAFSPDGKYLVSACADHKLYYYDVESGELVRTLLGHNDTVSFVTFDRSGSFIASGSNDRTMMIWDSQNGEKIAEFKGHKDRIAAIAYSDRFMASASWDKSVNIYYPYGNGRVKTTFLGHKDKVFSISWSPDGKSIASGSKDKSIKIWDVDNEAEKLSFDNLSGAVWDVKYSPDGSKIAGCTDDGKIYVFDSETGEPLALLKNKKAVRYIAWSPDGKNLVTGDEESTIRLWNTENYQCTLSMLEDNSGEWISWASEGYFIGSDNAVEKLKFVIDGAEYVPEQVFNSFYSPKLIAHKLQNGTLDGMVEETELTLYATLKNALPPSVKLSVTQDKENERKIHLKVNVRDTGGGIGTVQVKINGKLFFLSSGNEDSKKGNEENYEYETLLSNGDNRISAAAYNFDNSMRSTENGSNSLRIKYNGTPELPRLWLFSIACDKYIHSDEKDTFGNLNNAKLDANAVMQSFLSYQGNMYSDVIIRELYNTDVTEMKIGAEFDRNVQDVRPDDVFVLFLSGHGWATEDGKNYFYIPSDFSRMDCDSLEEAIEKRGLKGQTLRIHLGKIRALNTLVIMDTCQAGAFIADSELSEGYRGIKAVKNGETTEAGENEKLAIDYFARRSGWATIAATASNQSAYENFNGHGIFSYYVMRGLEGEADSDNNNIVTVTELSDFVEKKVSLENYKAFGERQSPKVHLMGQNFPLTGGMVKDVGKEFYEQGVAYEKLGEIALAKEWYEYAASQNYSGANEALKKIEEKQANNRLIVSGNCGAEGDNVTWELYENGDMILKGHGKMKNYETLDDRPWNEKQDEIEKLILEGSIENIGDYAFEKCDNLKSVILSENTVSVGYDAFENCDSLETFDFLNVEEIDMAAFCYCDNLKTIRFTEKLISIGFIAFEACDAIESVYIPSSVEKIDRACFAKCDKLTSIKVDKKNKSYKDIEGVLFTKDGERLVQYPSGNSRTEYIFPESVKYVGDDAFEECKNLKSVILSEKTVSVGYDAFENCDNLETFDFLNVEEIGAAAFSSCDSLKTIRFTDRLKSIGNFAFGACDAIESVYIPSSVEKIDRACFAKCDKLTSIKVDKKNKSYKDIEGVLFTKDGERLVQYPSGNSRTEYIFPESVKYVGDDAFEECKNLKSVILSEKTVSIGDDAFGWCNNLKTINFTEKLKSIEDSAFEFCENLESITSFSENPPTIEENVFPDTVKQIFVPEKSVQKYKEAEGWKKYAAKIVPIKENKKVVAESVPDDFVFVEGGTFQMGSNSRNDDEKPVHSVTVSSFYMCKHEVTQKEWSAVMGSNPSEFKGDNKPVEEVTWYDAIEYCNKRSKEEGLSPCYSLNGSTDTSKWGNKGGSWDKVQCNFSANGYRLPKEAEWEYAARGWKFSRGYEYSGSNEIDEVAWYYKNTGFTTHDVMTKQPNALGIYDMSGNVWEWCWDWYGSYSSGSQTDPFGVPSGSDRVVRGGGWFGNAPDCRVADRYYFSPGDSLNDIGFRVVRSSSR